MIETDAKKYIDIGAYMSTYMSTYMEVCVDAYMSTCIEDLHEYLQRVPTWVPI